MRLLFDRRGAGVEVHRQFIELFHPLLTDPHPTLRLGALDFIAFDHHRAPMYQFPYDRRVLDGVVELAKSKQAKERAAAASALAQIQGLDRDLSRSALLQLARDPVADVRGNAARGLAGQRDHPEAKAALAQLLKDESRPVQLRTIVELGSDPFGEHLKALTRGPDKSIARQAESLLKGIEQRKSQK